MKSTKIGFGIPIPQETCNDKCCPFHGTLKIRGKSFSGIVTSDKRQNTATVMWEGKRFVPKYERYEKTRTKVSAHNPPCINAEEGEHVDIYECKKLSKTVAFVIVKKSGKDREYFLEKEEAAEQAKKEKQEKQKDKSKLTERSKTMKQKEPKEPKEDVQHPGPKQESISVRPSELDESAELVEPDETKESSEPETMFESETENEIEANTEK